MTSTPPTTFEEFEAMLLFDRIFGISVILNNSGVLISVQIPMAVYNS